MRRHQSGRGWAYFEANGGYGGTTPHGVVGVATRLAAVGGLLLIGPIWIMLWPSDSYLWSYPLELFPLLLLAIVPAGRTLGLDRILAPRLHGRWPF